MTRRTSSSAGRTHRRSVGLDPCTSAGGTRVHPARQLARSADGRPKAHDDIDPVVVPRFRHRLRLPSYCGLMCTPPRCPRRTDGTYQLGVAGRVRPGNRRIEHRQLGRTSAGVRGPGVPIRAVSSENYVSTRHCDDHRDPANRQHRAGSRRQGLHFNCGERCRDIGINVTAPRMNWSPTRFAGMEERTNAGST